MVSSLGELWEWVGRLDGDCEAVGGGAALRLRQELTRPLHTCPTDQLQQQVPAGKVSSPAMSRRRPLPGMYNSAGLRKA